MIKSILSLQILKILELLIPVLVIPKVITEIGLSNYGTITLLLSVATYIILIGEWGFNINATREYVHLSKNKRILLYLDILKLKLIFSFFVILISCFLFFVNIDFLSIQCVILYSICGILVPRWYFQVNTKLHYLVYISILGKIIYLIYVFFYLDNVSKVYVYIFFFSLSSVFLMIFSNVYYLHKEKIKIREIFKYLFTAKLPDEYFFSLIYEGWNLTSSRIVSGLLNPIIFMITQHFLGLAAVGILGVCQKLSSAFISLINPIIDVLFPHLTIMVKSNASGFKNILIKMVSFYAFITTCFIILFMITHTYIFRLANINISDGYVGIMIVYFISIFFSLSNSLFVYGIVSIESGKEITIISVVCLCLTIISLFFLNFYNDIIVVVISFLFGQIISFFMALNVLRTKYEKSINF